MPRTPFDWSRLFTAVSDESFGIPSDVTFEIEEKIGNKKKLYEVKAHKMILGLVSPTFMTTFYATDVDDKTANVIRIEKTTAPAFKIMMDTVYNIKSIKTSLEGKSVQKVFDVLILADRYQIAELMEAVKEHLSNYPITDNNVLDVAAEAKEYTNMFEAEVHQLLCACAKFLKSKLKDVNAVARYAAEHEDQGEVFATLLARMNFHTSTPTKCANKTSASFNWSKLITEMSDDNFGIPSDVTFQIEENGQLHEMKAHKMILGMISPTFKTMFYATDVRDKTVKVIRIEKTTAPAFQIMMDAVYNIRSIKTSLEGKSVHEVFDIFILVERYQIEELMKTVKKHCANYPITDDTVLDVAAQAKECLIIFKQTDKQAEAHQLLCTCAKFLKSKLEDVNAVARYAAEHEDQGEVFATLLARMNDIATHPLSRGSSVGAVEVSADGKEEKGAARCDSCKKKFDEGDWGKLNRHKKLSHEMPCPNCDLMFVDEMDLAKHSKESHSIGKRH